MTRFTLLLTSVIILLIGCGGPGGPTQAPPQHAAPVLDPTVPTLPVRVIVLTRSDGSGNPLWTRGYVAELLDQASAEIGHAVTFHLESYQALPNDTLYAGLQADALAWAVPQGRPGLLTVVVSRPDTEDTAGQAMQSSKLLDNRAPVLVMRSRYLGWSGIPATSHILLHELAHNAGLTHEADPFLGRTLTTDTVYATEEGFQFLSRYVTIVKGL